MNDGSQPLEKSHYERFCHMLTTPGPNGRPLKPSECYRIAFESRAKETSLKAAARSCMRRPDVKARLAFLSNDARRRAHERSIFSRDRVEESVIEILERCLGNRRVKVPKDLEKMVFIPCDACEDVIDDESMCRGCRNNLKAIEAWSRFGGIYEFDARTAVRAAELLGRDRDLFTQNQRIDVGSSLDGMSPEQVQAMIEAHVKEMGGHVSWPSEPRGASTGPQSERPGEVPPSCEAAGVPPTRIH